ncbi:putative partition-like protein [uncultured Alphaproteobacteria bacterium]|uniref:Putative partition-like protein n=1 Tax=uncultured Alphaproteobacteria bacterium TaxID=91750 RepID=A0A212JVA8_9PROT|nr:putative partition-like protein [uncultured Alphaproteobacteria bacterium]
MMIVAVVNTKGGSGKTTIATHLAAHFAQRGVATGLADLDPQESAAGWLARRPYTLPAIHSVDLEKAKPPKSLDRLVVDAPAALKRKAVAEVVATADVLVIPVLPSVFDEDGTRRFLAHIEDLKAVRKGRRDVCFVANRVRLRTRAAERLEAFLAEMRFPVMARLRDTLTYANLVAEGQTLFDVPGAKFEDHRRDWRPLLDYLDNCAPQA